MNPWGSDVKILCPDCPVCGHPPGMALGPEQAFCTNDNCQALNWNMTITQAENVAGTNYIDLSKLDYKEQPE